MLGRFHPGHVRYLHTDGGCVDMALMHLQHVCLQQRAGRLGSHH